MMQLIVLSILAVLQLSGSAAKKVDTPPPLPVVKAVNFGGSSLFGGGTVGGQEATGTIELSGPAPCVVHCGTFVNGRPAGGMFVQVSSNNAVARVQPPTGMILVPVGQTRQTFTVLTSGVSNPTPVLISAWRDGSPAQTTTLNVLPPSLTGFTIDQSTLVSGAGAHGTLTFNGAPGAAGVVVATLSSNNAAAVQVPATVALDVNKTVATFDLKTSGVSTNTPVNIFAAYRDRKESATLTITPAVLTKFDAEGLQLNGAAPPSGAVINLSSEDPAHVSAPASVTIPAGGSKAGVSYSVQWDYSNHNVTISAKYNGVTKKHDVYVAARIKADLAIKEVTLQDRFGNAITHPQDSQTYKMCVTIEMLGAPQPNANYLYPQSTVLHVAYLSPTGTGTSVGRDFDVSVSFSLTVGPGSWSFGAGVQENNSAMWFLPTCIDMPGLPQSGSHVDVTLTVDPNNKIDESHEGNNTYKLRVTRQ